MIKLSTHPGLKVAKKIVAQISKDITAQYGRSRGDYVRGMRAVLREVKARIEAETTRFEFEDKTNYYGDDGDPCDGWRV